MTVFLRATNRRGLSPPWPYVRAKLAEHWGCLPPMVDELPMSEIALQLKIWELEGSAQSEQARRSQR